MTPFLKVSQRMHSPNFLFFLRGKLLILSLGFCQYILRVQLLPNSFMPYFSNHSLFLQGLYFFLQKYHCLLTLHKFFLSSSLELLSILLLFFTKILKCGLHLLSFIASTFYLSLPILLQYCFSFLQAVEDAPFKSTI